MNSSEDFIGLLDSGVGGLTVLHEAMQAMPDENFLYYADREHAPYGEKSKSKIRSLTLACVRSMESFGLKALVVACNTATSAAVKELRAQYPFPIVGMEPAVKPAVSDDPGKRVLVLATPLTLREEKFRKLVSQVDPGGRVDCIGMPALVRLAEAGTFSGDQVVAYFDQQFAGLDWDQYSTVVLGCTHFIFFRACLKRYLPTHLAIIDGNEGTIRNLKKQVAGSNSSSVRLKFVDSDKTVDKFNFQVWLDFLEND